MVVSQSLKADEADDPKESPAEKPEEESPEESPDVAEDKEPEEPMGDDDEARGSIHAPFDRIKRLRRPM
jgi:hypothetical protein